MLLGLGQAISYEPLAVSQFIVQNSSLIVHINPKH